MICHLGLSAAVNVTSGVGALLTLDTVREMMEHKGLITLHVNHFAA